MCEPGLPANTLDPATKECLGNPEFGMVGKLDWISMRTASDGCGWSINLSNTHHLKKHIQYARDGYGIMDSLDSLLSWLSMMTWVIIGYSSTKATWIVAWMRDMVD